MAKVIQDNIFKMKNKEEENLTMEMAPIIKANGLKVDNMEKENLNQTRVKLIKVDINTDNQRIE
jgi:hypothetical protein